MKLEARIIELDPHADGQKQYIRLDLAPHIWVYFDKLRAQLRTSSTAFYMAIISDMPAGYNLNFWLVHLYKKAKS